jgi:hypothetical protein
MTALLALLGAIAKPLVEWFQTSGYALLEKLLIYRKGAKDQRMKDDVARLEREAGEVTRAAERIEEKRREELDAEAAGRKPGDGTIRVRKPGSDIKW